jgi:hypothetical protein
MGFEVVRVKVKGRSRDQREVLGLQNSVLRLNETEEGGFEAFRESKLTWG